MQKKNPVTVQARGGPITVVQVREKLKKAAAFPKGKVRFDLSGHAKIEKRKKKKKLAVPFRLQRKKRSHSFAWKLELGKRELPVSTGCLQRAPKLTSFCCERPEEKIT